MVRLILAIGFICCLCTACDSEQNKAKDGTYIGGEIVNPVSNSVILRKDGEIISDLSLSQNNRFFYKVKDLIPGLYGFYHNERQLVFLEEGDSIILRVNTMDYDESLTFTGYGAAKNNFMMDMFLLNEKENKSIMSIYQQSPEIFANTIDSLKEEREKLWDSFKDKYEVSDRFKNVIEAIIDYDSYARMEVYPISHFGQDRIALLDSLPDDFYEYHEDIDFNRDELVSLYSYQRFLINYFNLAAYKEYYHDEPYDSESFTHNLYKLRIIDSTVSNDSIKSYLLTRTIRDYLANSNDKNGGQQLYELYMSRIPSDLNKKQIEDIYVANQNIESGKSFPDEVLINTAGEKIDIDGLIKKPTFIFFWSKDKRSHMRKSHFQAKELQSKFPEFNYLALNIDKSTNEWLKLVELNQFDTQHEFQFEDFFSEIQKDLAITSIYKTFIVDENGMIINGHANMFSTNFESQLLEALNR
tara:strand:+ start:630 stop:2039 length:1410 start_codon:yes stop_codon:yes gene_type:complete